jgi:hypothetical protein
MLHNVALNSFLDNLGLDWAVLVGAAISYLLCGMPRLKVLQSKLQPFMQERSSNFQASVEFAVVVGIGWAVVNYLMAPQNPQAAFAGGLSWYSLLNGVFHGRRA